MCLETQFSQVILRLSVHASRATDLFNSIKVARNEVKNASFAQCSAHRDSRIWRPELIEPAAERKRRARADDDRRSNRPTPTHRFCHSAIFRPITPFNVWFFSVSRHRSIILAKTMETFRADFEKFQEMCETWIIENVNWSQTRLGILPSSLWKVFLKFFFQMNRKPMRKNSYWASVHRAFSQRREKQGCFFGYFFVWVPIFDPTLVQYFIENTPHNFLLPVISIW